MKKKIFWKIESAGLEFTKEEWHNYLGKKAIKTTIGDFTFNDCDVCINAKEEVSFKLDKFFYVTFTICDCGNGWYTYGLDYSAGGCGGGFLPHYADDNCLKEKRNWRKAYKSQKELRDAWCNEAINWLKSSIAYREGNNKAKRLVEFVEEYKKTISRPKVVQLTLF